MTTSSWNKLATARVKDLTPGAKEKPASLAGAATTDHFYYTSNKSDPRYFDLYKMDTTTWKSNMIYKNDNGFDVGALSDNERYLALIQTLTTSSNNILPGRPANQTNQNS